MPHSLIFSKPTDIKLTDIDAAPPSGTNKDEALQKTEELAKEMEELLDLLFYAGKHSLLIVLQGMDTSGKDGTIRHILNYSNAQSCKVAPFKVPTPLELSHDFLWRVHQQAPPRGGITVFNRSHYEDVLVVRVHELVKKDVWKKRYETINAFESLLAESGTIILKFFLHITKKEQEERLREREQDVEKAWKLSVGDWKEREFWDDYQEAYEDVLSKCSTEYAPWQVVPSDNKWYRNLVVTEAIVNRLRVFRDPWMKDLTELGQTAKAELDEFRASAKS